MEVIIIDSGCANIASVRYAFERMGYKAHATSDKRQINSAERVILPGVGSAPAAMKQLKELDLVETITNLTQPVMGICLGMQLLFNHSQEYDTPLLNIINAPINKFSSDVGIIPHMGWNTVKQVKDSPLFEGIKGDAYFYFVHSFRADCGDYTLGQCDYGDSFSAIIKHNNFFGCQFHPERSSDVGATLLKNFIEGSL